MSMVEPVSLRRRWGGGRLEGNVPSSPAQAALHLNLGHHYRWYQISIYVCSSWIWLNSLPNPPPSHINFQASREVNGIFPCPIAAVPRADVPSVPWLRICGCTEKLQALGKESNMGQLKSQLQWRGWRDACAQKVGDERERRTCWKRGGGKWE